ncbi:hypothetical protein M1O12_04450 [Dehalococcoidia bacterium]|nr:hypothetical protein [Dehalococcoidia bacterium]
MLVEYLQKVIASGGDEPEIEYRDRKEWFTAFNGPLGVGIGSLDSDKAKPIFKELAELKKAERVTIGNQSYALRFRQFESFGETVHRIQMNCKRPQKAAVSL